MYTYEYGNSSDEENDQNTLPDHTAIKASEHSIRQNSSKQTKGKEIEQRDPDLEVIDLTYLKGSSEKIEGSTVPSRSKRIKLKAINAMKTELKKSEKDEEKFESLP